MNIAQYIASLAINLVRDRIDSLKVGSFHTFTYKKVWGKKQLAKGNKHLDVVEIKKINARIGVDGDKTQEVKENRENGNQPAQNQGLPPYKEWVEGKKGIILRHKGNGQRYVRTYRRKGEAKGVVGKTRYFVEGNEVTKEELQSLLIPSALTYSGPEMPYRDLKEDCILDIA